MLFIGTQFSILYTSLTKVPAGRAQADELVGKQLRPSRGLLLEQHVLQSELAVMWLWRCKFIRWGKETWERSCNVQA